tara:strand:+ start:4376 stop:4573 length:198 start_codon:yes stop_codon:yes gene_type:complete
MSVINNWLEKNGDEKIREEAYIVAFNKRQILNDFSEWLEKDDEHNLINQYTVDSYLEYEKANKLT